MKNYVLILLLFVLSCSNNNEIKQKKINIENNTQILDSIEINQKCHNDAISKTLMEIIKNFMYKSTENKDEFLIDKWVYSVIFFEKDSKSIFYIDRSDSYISEKIDGYITVGNNLIIFINSNIGEKENIIDINKLEKDITKIDYLNEKNSKQDMLIDPYGDIYLIHNKDNIEYLYSKYLMEIIK